MEENMLEKISYIRKIYYKKKALQKSPIGNFDASLILDYREINLWNNLHLQRKSKLTFVANRREVDHIIFVNFQTSVA